MIKLKKKQEKTCLGYKVYILTPSLTLYYVCHEKMKLNFYNRFESVSEGIILMLINCKI